MPIGDLLAAGLRINAPRVAGELSRVSVPAHQLSADVVEQAHVGEGERALATRVAKLEQALAVERERREGAERLAAEQAARTEDLRVSLRMLDEAPRPCRWQATAAPMMVAVGRAAELRSSH